MFHGSIVALVTPMKANGEVDYLALEKLVDWHLQHKTDAIVVLGTTGESPTIENDERTRIIESVVGQVKNKIPVIIGTGVNSTQHTIALTLQAMELGADAVLLVTPYYNKPTQEGLFQHFKLIAETVPIPQILYNVPSRTGVDMFPETILRLSSFPNIVGVKEATGDVTRVKKLLASGSELDLLSGDDGTAMEFMLAGGKGVISVVANIAPELVHDMCEVAIAGDRAKAEAHNKKLEVLYKPLSSETNPIPTKWALFEMGLIEPGIRLPLTPLNEKFHETVRMAMKQANIRA